MFYSHDILTERRHGMAVVWLVATLGPKPPTKRVNKKSILNVNIQKACDTVKEPVAPMALRLQSSLLVGISRVFSSQCGYVLSDAEIAQQNMILLLRAAQGSQLDPDAGKSRPELLLLPDDPSFAPDVLPQIDLEFPPLDFDTRLSQTKASSSTTVSSQLSASDISRGGFEVAPANEAQNIPDIASAHREPDLNGAAFLDLTGEQTLLSDAGFFIDEDGNLIDESENLFTSLPPMIRTEQLGETLPVSWL